MNIATLQTTRLALPYFILLPLCVVAFAVASLASFYGTRALSKKPITGTYTVTTEKTAQGEEKKVVCPINGGLYTEEQSKLWEDRRPLGVMIENQSQARPQSGLSKADVVYEAVAEGGITRFLAVYLCQEPELVGPVRSARTYFLDWISEYDGLYAHVGGASKPGPADAIGQIRRYGIRDLDQFYVPFLAFHQDKQRISQGIAIEHTMYASPKKLWDGSKDKFGWGAVDEKTGARWDEGFVPWHFIDEKPQAQASSSATIQVPFWDRSVGEYTVRWTYDAKTNTYKRENGGRPHIESLTNEQLATKNVVVQFATEERANDGYPGNLHLLYGTIGSGEAWIFQNGTLVKGTWRKKDRLGRTKFFDSSANEISFVRGQVWIQVVPVTSKATIKVVGPVL